MSQIIVSSLSTITIWKFNTEANINGLDTLISSLLWISLNVINEWTDRLTQTDELTMVYNRFQLTGNILLDR